MKNLQSTTLFEVCQKIKHLSRGNGDTIVKRGIAPWSRPWGPRTIHKPPFKAHRTEFLHSGKKEKLGKKYIRLGV